MTRATLDTTGELVRKATPTRRLGGPEDLKGSPCCSRRRPRATSPAGDRRGRRRHPDMTELPQEMGGLHEEDPFSQHLGIKVDSAGKRRRRACRWLRPES